MDRYHLHWFTDEIEVHASIALQAYERLAFLLSDPATRQSREVWYAVFSFLAHTAMVSKLFKPIRTEHRARGQELKNHLQIEAGSALLAREARDNLEHIDERIDGWAQRGESKIIEMVFDDREGYDYILGRDGAVRRVLIMDEMVFVSEGSDGRRTETQLNPIRDELAGLRDRCLDKLLHASPYTMILPSRDER